MVDLMDRVSITPQQRARQRYEYTTPLPHQIQRINGHNVFSFAGETQGTLATASTPPVAPDGSPTIIVELPRPIDLTSPERTHRTRSDKLRMNVRRGQGS
jgi:hypothetical protein